MSEKKTPLDLNHYTVIRRTVDEQTLKVGAGTLTQALKLAREGTLAEYDESGKIVLSGIVEAEDVRNISDVCKPKKGAPAVKPKLDPILPRLEKALLKSGLSATAFCYTHFGDPAVLTRMRNGRKMHKLRRDAERICAEYGIGK